MNKKYFQEFTGGAVLATVEADYRAMTNMIFGAVPAFADIVASLRALEAEINALAVEPDASG